MTQKRLDSVGYVQVGGAIEHWAQSINDSQIGISSKIIAPPIELIFAEDSLVGDSLCVEVKLSRVSSQNFRTATSVNLDSSFIEVYDAPNEWSFSNTKGDYIGQVIADGVDVQYHVLTLLLMSPVNTKAWLIATSSGSLV